MLATVGVRPVTLATHFLCSLLEAIIYDLGRAHSETDSTDTQGPC